MSSNLPHFVITVGRSFGSGGRSLGQALARHFGVPFYDRELLSRAAERAGLDAECFERNDERTPQFLSGIYTFNMGVQPFAWQTGGSSISGDSLYRAQCDFIREVAARESCVIVGRTADYVLRDMPGVVNIFVHAPEEECVRRIIGRSETPLTPAQALTLLRKTNRLRANFYNFYSDKTWGDSASYHLTVDSSCMPLDQLTKAVGAFVEATITSNLS